MQASGRNSIVVLAVGVVLLLNGGLCSGFWQDDQQSMECCATMRCPPANQAQDCCKTMVQELGPYFKPAAKVSFQAPVEIGVATVPEFNPFSVSVAFQHRVDANEHAPPRELYTVYLSLLI